MTDYIHDEWCYSREGGDCSCYVHCLIEKDERIAELEAEYARHVAYIMRWGLQGLDEDARGYATQKEKE